MIENTNHWRVMYKLELDPHVLIKRISLYCKKMSGTADDERPSDMDKEIAKTNLGQNQRENVKDLLMRTADAEQLGIKVAHEPEKILPPEEKHDPHRHLDFFPVVIVEEDRLENIDMSKAIERAQAKMLKDNVDNELKSDEGSTRSHDDMSQFKKNKASGHRSDDHSHRLHQNT